MVMPSRDMLLPVASDSLFLVKTKLCWLVVYHLEVEAKCVNVMCFEQNLLLIKNLHQFLNLSCGVLKMYFYVLFLNKHVLMYNR